MLLPRLRLNVVDADAPSDGLVALRARFAAIRAENDLVDTYPERPLAEAAAAAKHARLPERDESDVPFITIDPVGSMDLDQAMHLERSGTGYRVRYAIADVPSFVRPGGALDAETRARAVTVYSPDERVPLHPTVLSEQAASLLPNVDRPAFVWDLILDSDGALTDTRLYRAMVRSRAKLDYIGVQAQIDAGTADPMIGLLGEIGALLAGRERDRGGASLPLPEQEITAKPDGGFTLTYRPGRELEGWNAHISLLTGMAAAALQLEGGVGLLRTMPKPEERNVARLRDAARALGAAWPPGDDYGAFLATLDQRQGNQLALIHAATALFRGAGYTPFDGAPPDETMHAAVAAPYAHVTAPLRRLVDRFGLVICEALANGTDVPGWAREALPSLPDAMKGGDHRASAVERASADAMEAAVLAHRIGEVFDAVVVGQREDSVDLQLAELPVLARGSGSGPALGESVKARLTDADVATSTVRFAVEGARP